MSKHAALVMRQSAQRPWSVLAARANPVFGLEITFQPALVSQRGGLSAWIKITWKEKQDQEKV